MKLSVVGFKSIQEVKDFEVKPLTLLAGVNSSGKSSLIQVLLLLKQTLESGTDEALALSGPYVYADKLQDLQYGKKTSVTKIKMTFDKEDLSEYIIREAERYVHELQELTYFVSFKPNGWVHVDQTTIEFKGEIYSAFFDLVRRGASEYAYLATNTDPNAKRLYNRPRLCTPTFSGMFPLFVEISKAGNFEMGGMLLPAFKIVKQFLDDYFKNIYFQAPTHVSPALSIVYKTTPESRYVDSDGQNLQFVLAERKKYIVNEAGETLEMVLSHWLQDELHLADRMEVTRDKSQSYHTLLNVKSDLSVDLCQVGFGTSQILPILVQGLLTPKGGILIVEDPDVHMHPSVQAGMIDFFIAMAKEGKTVIIETHSDHMVTRLRRRIAERNVDVSSVSLNYVEMTPSGSLYTDVAMTDQAAFTAPLPKGFLNTQDEDFRAIIHAKLNR